MIKHILSHLGLEKAKEIWNCPLYYWPKSSERTRCYNYNYEAKISQEEVIIGIGIDPVVALDKGVFMLGRRKRWWFSNSDWTVKLSFITSVGGNKLQVTGVAYSDDFFPVTSKVTHYF